MAGEPRQDGPTKKNMRVVEQIALRESHRGLRLGNAPTSVHAFMSARCNVFLAVGFAVVALVGCARRESAVEAGIATRTIYINLGAEPRDFDPQTTSLPADGMVIRATMEGLAELDPTDCRAIPGVATRWET